MDLPQPSTAKAVSSRDFKQRNRRRRKRRTRKSGGGGATQPPPPSPTVLSLMEMGFPRNAVERAVKAMPNASPSPVRLSKNVLGKIEKLVFVKPFLSTLKEFHWANISKVMYFPLLFRKASLVGCWSTVWWMTRVTKVGRMGKTSRARILKQVDQVILLLY